MSLCVCLSVCVALQTEEPTLTGQEDPMFLHGVINTFPIQTAYREGMDYSGHI